MNSKWLFNKCLVLCVQLQQPRFGEVSVSINREATLPKHSLNVVCPVEPARLQWEDGWPRLSSQHVLVLPG